MKLLSHKVKIQSKFASPLSRTYLLQKKKKKKTGIHWIVE